MQIESWTNDKMRELPDQICQRFGCGSVELSVLGLALHSTYHKEERKLRADSPIEVSYFIWGQQI